MEKNISLKKVLFKVILVRKFGAQNIIKKTKNKKMLVPKKFCFKKKFARKKFVPIFFDDFE